MTSAARIEAKYTESPVAEYCGNPLIEAMPAILSEAEAAVRIGMYPPLPESERDLPGEVRLHCTNRLTHLIQPLAIHLELESSISSILRSGYVGRNPMDGITWQHLHALSAQRTPAPKFNSTASTFSLVGLSGIGKSTALDAVLRLYPQVLAHREYQGREFIHTQIVWLKLECPFDGSLSGLCHAFFQAVDKATGEDRYAKRYRGKGGVQELIQRMQQIASTYFIGGLFIDELQHLRTAKTGGKDNMLNFFVNLINNIGIPVVFIGTNSMIGLFSTVFRNARRASGLGLLHFEQPDEEDSSWALLVKAVWRYQWVRQVEPLSPAITALLYDLTQGVTDFLTKLMILGQRYAIQSGKERLDATVFKHVAATKMKLLQPALAALRSRDPVRMAKFEDLLPPDDKLAAMMNDDEMVYLGRLALLEGLQGKAESKDQESSVEVANPPVSIVSQQASRATVVTISSTIAEVADPVQVLKDASWLLEDPFEFTPAYRAA
ncbi:hypothetical protein GCM10027321_28380 [Massilia terrae]